MSGHYFLHVVEHEDGKWHCSRGRWGLDEHGALTDALKHLRDLAAAVGAPHVVEIVVHGLDQPPYIAPGS